MLRNFYPFNIIMNLNHSIFREEADIPIIIIQIDVFVIGNIDISKTYKIINLIVNLFQQRLYINVGEDKPKV